MVTITINSQRASKYGRQEFPPATLTFLLIVMVFLLPSSTRDHIGVIMSLIPSMSKSQLIFLTTVQPPFLKDCYFVASLKDNDGDVIMCHGKYYETLFQQTCGWILQGNGKELAMTLASHVESKPLLVVRPLSSGSSLIIDHLSCSHSTCVESLWWCVV